LGRARPSPPPRRLPVLVQPDQLIPLDEEKRPVASRAADDLRAILMLHAAWDVLPYEHTNLCRVASAFRNSARIPFNSSLELKSRVNKNRQQEERVREFSAIQLAGRSEKQLLNADPESEDSNRESPAGRPAGRQTVRGLGETRKRRELSLSAFRVNQRAPRFRGKNPSSPRRTLFVTILFGAVFVTDVCRVRYEFGVRPGVPETERNGCGKRALGLTENSLWL
jgi:hypothetical protein